MRAYNSIHVQNRALRQQADRWQREGLIQPDQREAIRQAFPVPFRESNVFAELGSFVFTVLAVGGAYAFVLLLINGIIDNKPAFAGFNGLVSLVLVFLLHTFIREAQFYRNGPDNALVVMAASFLVTAVNIALPDSAALWLRCLVSVPVLLAFAIYYGEVIVAFMALASFFAAFFTGFLEFDWGRMALPFMLMVVSLLLKWVLNNVQSRLTEADQTYYADALSMGEWVCLIVLAAAGNYFVVRELNGLLADVPAGQARPEVAPQIALPALFWVLTFLIPTLYAYLGLTRKNRMYVILGALGLAGATSTVRYYFPLLPLSIHLTLIGTLLIGAAAMAIRYLRQPRFGFTDAPDEESPRQFFLNSELLSVMQATGTTINRQPDMKFGGGDFGGGGAGRDY